MRPKRPKYCYAWLIIAVIFAPLSLCFASDITGTWEGKFSCGDEEFSWQLAVDESAPNRLAGGLAFVRLSDGAKGSHKVRGAYNPNRGRVSLGGAGWIQKVDGLRQLGLRGLYDQNSGTISGEFLEKACGSFTIKRTSMSVAVPEVEPAPAGVYQRAKSTAAAGSASAQPTRPSTAALSRNKVTEARCEQIRAWSNELENAYPEVDFYRIMDGLVTRMVSGLFDDQYFVPVFGKPFDTLGEGERQTIFKQQLIPCLRRAELKSDYDWQISYLGNPFILKTGMFNHVDVVKELRKRRATLEWLETTIRHLDAMKATADDYESLLALDREAAKRLANMWPRQMRSFETAIAGPLQVSAEIILTREVSKALAATTSADDLLKLGNFLSTHADLAEDAGSDARIAAGTRIESLAIKIMRKALFDLGTGIDALNAQIAWYDAFTRLSNKLGESETLVALEAEFLERREATWNANEKKLIEMMRNAPSTAYIAANRPPMPPYDRGMAAAMRMSTVASKRRADLIWKERIAFMARWGMDPYKARQPIESLRVRKEDVVLLTTKQTGSTDIASCGPSQRGLMTPGGPVVTGGVDLACALQQLASGRQGLAEAERYFQAARRAFFECGGKCPDRDTIAQTLRQMWFARDWGVAAAGTIKNTFGFSDAEMNEAASWFEELSGGHRPMDARVCPKEIEPWADCVSKPFAAVSENRRGSVSQCWDEYQAYDDCRNVAEQIRLEKDFMSQSERLQKKGVNEELVWLAQAVRNHYGYGSDSLTLEKSDYYLQCFGEERMKRLSRKYLHPDSAVECRSGAAMSCVVAELRNEKDDKVPGKPADIWDCSDPG